MYRQARSVNCVVCLPASTPTSDANTWVKRGQTPGQRLVKHRVKDRSNTRSKTGQTPVELVQNKTTRDVNNLPKTGQTNRPETGQTDRPETVENRPRGSEHDSDTWVQHGSEGSQPPGAMRGASDDSTRTRVDPRPSHSTRTRVQRGANAGTPWAW